MESHAHRRFSTWLAVATLVSVFAALPARADSHLEPPVDVWVETNPDEITVEAEQDQANAGDNAGGSGGGSGPSCYLRDIPESEWTEDLTLDYFRFRMRKAAYYLICDGENRGIVWIDIDLSDPSDTSGEPITPRDIAERLRDRIPVPRVDVEINPDGGVVGVESWFWIDGYDGTPITNSTDAFGDLIEVEARVTRYEWSFGDGSSSTSESPGRAYPSRSEVRHTYERSSAGFTDGYPVDVTFVFAVRYRVDGGPWTVLPGIRREAHADYPVRESQAVIQR